MRDHRVHICSSQVVEPMASSLKRLAVKLLNCDEEKLPSSLLVELQNVAAKAEQEMIEKAGKFLHNIRVGRQTIEEINSVVKAFPASVLHTDDEGRLPIQVTARFDTMEFIPYIAQAHVHSQFEVTTDGDKRGGLLCKLIGDPFNRNVIQCIVNLSSDRIDNDLYDIRCVKVLYKLREKELLLREDIETMNLLFYSVFSSSQRRFDFLADWYPDAMRLSKWRGKPLIHATIGFKSIASFDIVLKASMRHFPSKIGFLFMKYQGKTACEAACEKYGIHETMATIKKCIPPSDNVPILHHVVRFAPKYLHEFKIRYPEAVHLRDSSGRLLFHTELYCRRRIFCDDPKFFTKVSDYDLAEQDPVTGLYPFMIAASEERCDLTGVYILCRRRPDLFEVCDNTTERSSLFSYAEEGKDHLFCCLRRQRICSYKDMHEFPSNVHKR